MIIKTEPSDIFKQNDKHIAFAINTEGFNYSGFAGEVARTVWPELANIGNNEIGEVLSKQVGDTTYHALVCHSLHNGWGTNQREVIKTCFDKIDANNESINSIAIGTGFIGQLSGANVPEIVCGMLESKQKIILHANFSLDDINKYYKSHPSTENPKTFIRK